MSSIHHLHLSKSLIIGLMEYVLLPFIAGFMAFMSVRCWQKKGRLYHFLSGVYFILTLDIIIIFLKSVKGL